MKRRATQASQRERDIIQEPRARVAAANAASIGSLTSRGSSHGGVSALSRVTNHTGAGATDPGEAYQRV